MKNDDNDDGSEFEANEVRGAESPEAKATADVTVAPKVARGIKLADLRLSQDFGATLGVKKQLVTVPVRKPDRQTFFRVHPDPEWQLQAAVVDLKEERETYLVAPALRDSLLGEVTLKLMVTAITRQGVTFLWPLRLPGADGRQDEWSRSAMAAAEMARGTWVRLSANMDLNAYDVSTASSGVGEPEWPDVSFEQLVQIAFKDLYIDDVNHPVLRRLRGEV